MQDWLVMAARIDIEMGEANWRNKTRANTECPALLQLVSLPFLKQFSLLTFLSTVTGNTCFYLFTGIVMLCSWKNYGWLAKRVGTASALLLVPSWENLETGRLQSCCHVWCGWVSELKRQMKEGACSMSWGILQQQGYTARTFLGSWVDCAVLKFQCQMRKSESKGLFQGHSNARVFPSPPFCFIPDGLCRVFVCVFVVCLVLFACYFPLYFKKFIPQVCHCETKL